MDATNLMLNVIASNYFTNFRCIQVICSFESQLTLETNIPVVINLLDGDNEISLDICDAFVVAAANPVKIFESLELKIRRQHMQKYRRRRYVFFANKTDLYDFERSIYLEGVFDLIMVSPNNWVEDLHYFVWSNGTGQSILADTWNMSSQSFALGANLYPNKMANRFFYVGAFHDPPYSFMNSTDGIELKLLAEFCKYNKVVLKVLDLGMYNWGAIWANWTGRGIFGCLLNYTCHAGIGGFYFYATPPLYLDYIMPVVKSGTNCLVPVPSLETSLMIAFMPFLKETWILIATSLVIFVFSWNIFTNIQNSSKIKTYEIGWTVLTLFLQQGTDLDNEKRKMYRIIRLLCFILILTLEIGISYPSKLFTQITHPKYSKPIDSMDDLDKSGFRWGAPSAIFPKMINTDKNPQLISKYVQADEGTLMQLFRKGEFALVIEHLTFGFMSPYSFEVDFTKFMAMKHNLHWTYTAILLQMNSVWQPSLQKHLLNVRDGGLQHFWERQVFNKMGMGALQDNIQKRLSSEPSVLSLWQIRGIFLVWFVGIIISLVTLLLELVYHCNRFAKILYSFIL